MKKSQTRSLAYGAILLAVCICFQFLKNLSVYLTGPVINACLILGTITAGWVYGIILAIITPVTSFLITGSPIMAAIPMIIPCVMIGNACMVLSVHFLRNKPNRKIGYPLSIGIGTLSKALFMGIVISLIIIPAYLPEKMTAMKVTFQTTFSITQVITGILGGIIAYLVSIPLKQIKD